MAPGASTRSEEEQVLVDRSRLEQSHQEEAYTDPLLAVPREPVSQNLHPFTYRQYRLEFLDLSLIHYFLRSFSEVD